MFKNAKFKKIVWAVNGRQLDDTVLKAAEPILEVLVQKHAAKVEPVFLYRPDAVEVAFNLDASKIEKIKEYESFQIDSRLKEEGIDFLEKPQVLVDIAHSWLQPYEMLTNYAQKEEVDFILVATHSWSSINRIVLGSFVERLLESSPVPVLIVTPETKVFGDLDEIVFATDFSPLSKAVFERAILFAKKLNASIKIFHRSPLNNDREESEKNAKEWAHHAEDAGIEATFEVIEDFYSPSDVIINNLRPQEKQMVALATHRVECDEENHFSVARQVLKNASCPVWIFFDDPPEEVGKVTCKVQEA